MITTFDKANLKALRAEIDDALKALGEKHGVSFRAGSASYMGATAKFTLELATPAAADAARALLERYCTTYSLDPAKTSLDGFRLTGFDANNRTRPFMAEKVSAPGSTYQMNLQEARMRFGKAA